MLASGLIHLTDSRIYVFELRGLLSRSVSDFRYNDVYVVYLNENVFKRCTRLIDQSHTSIHLCARSRNQAVDLLGGGGRALCKAPDLGCDNREATARFTGAGGFNRRVEREQIGLTRDLVDDVDDMTNLLR